MSDQLDAFGVQIEKLSTDIEIQNEKINEDIGSLEENFSSLEDELDNASEIFHYQGQMIEQNLNNITEIQESIEAIDDRIEENSNNIKYLNSSIDLLYAIIGEYDDQIESLQTNVVEVDSKIGEVEEHQKELRNDFEYLKYDFRSFTNEISKWQIDVDERLSGTEDHIQGIL